MTARPTNEELVQLLELAPHPEGGFYRETYRASERLDALPSRFAGPRAVSTAIYFLIVRGTFSALHRIQSDEVWHFYEGAPLRVVVLHEDGSRGDVVLGLDLAAGQRPQHVVPAGTWFGAQLEGDGDRALVGCTVAPGFDFDDFELGARGDLLERFPQHADVVHALTRA